MAAPLLRAGRTTGRCADKTHVSFVQVSLETGDKKDFFDTLSLSAGAVDDLADLPLAETELSRQRPVVAAVEPGPDVPVTGVALQRFPFGDVQALSAAQ